MNQQTTSEIQQPRVRAVNESANNSNLRAMDIAPLGAGSSPA